VIDLTDRLEAVPLLTHAAVRALRAEGPALQAVGADAGPVLRLVWAELLRAAGLGAHAERMSASVDAAALDPARRRRLAFVRGHFLQTLPHARASRLTDPTPLGLARQAILEARHAMIAGSAADAATAWQRVLATQAAGRRADELVFEAAFTLGQALVRGDAPADGLALFARADSTAERLGSPADRASLSLATLHGLQRTGDRDGVRALALRCDGLPTNVVGALPVGVVQQILAADEALSGDPVAALRRLHTSKLAARDREEWEAYAALSVSEARLTEPADPYAAYRQLKLAGARLRKARRADLAELVRSWIDQLAGRHGAATAADWRVRLRTELTA
jgi:hypothetical protein